MGFPMEHVRTLRLSLIHLTWNTLSCYGDSGIGIGSGLLLDLNWSFTVWIGLGFGFGTGLEISMVVL